MNTNASDGLSSRAPPPGIAQRLVAVPWRHAGLIAVFALAGGLVAMTSLWPRPVPLRVVVQSRIQPIQDAPSSPVADLGLRLELDLGAPGVAPASVQIAEASPDSSAALRLDQESAYDDIDAMLLQAPPAFGRPMHARAEPGDRPRATLPGLVAGLLLGLLVAALRELGGQRMRSPREARWALGAPVLGAIPTLSARSRDALVEAPPAA